MSQQIHGDRPIHSQLFQAMASGVVYHDETGQIIDANPAAERMLGLTRDEILGRFSTDERWHAMHEDGSPFPGEEHPSMVALQTGLPVYDVLMGVFHPRADETRWISISAIPEFREDEDKPFRVFATFVDVTDRENLRRELETAKRHLEDAQRVACVGSYEYLPITRETRWSDQLYRLHGWPIGTTPPTLEEFVSRIIEEDQPRWHEAYERYQETNILDVEVRHRRFDSGEERHIRVWAEIQRDRAGNDIRHLGVIHDISERRRVQHVLRESEERLSLALESAEMGTWDWFPQSQSAILNDRWASMLGYTLDEIEQSFDFWKSQIHPEDLDRVMDGLEAHLEGRASVYEEEHRLKHKDGHWVPVLTNGRVLSRDEQGRPTRVCGILYDLSRLARNKAALGDCI